MRTPAKPAKPRPVRVPVGAVPHVQKPTHAETTGHVPANIDDYVDGSVRDDEPTRPSIPTTRPPAGPQRGDRVLYTNRLGVGPWPGTVEDAHVMVAGTPGCWLHVTKPNGNDFFTAATMGDGPDQFTLADD